MGNVPEKISFQQIIDELHAQDKRYKPDAYEFILQSLYFTQGRLKRKGHVSGQELSEGVRDFAIQRFGPMAKTVLKHWGISKTEDFGNVVFNMINKKVLSKTEEDSIADFKEVFNFDTAFDNVLRDSVEKLRGFDG